MSWLRDDEELSFGFLSSLTATDWPGKDPRFWIVYDLRSMEHHHRARVKVGLSEDDAHVPTVTDLFPTANWYERETFDFFGIVFDGHPDLTRILLPDGLGGLPAAEDRRVRRRQHPLPRRVHPAGRHPHRHLSTRPTESPTDDAPRLAHG